MATIKNNLFVGSAIGSLKGVNVKKEDGFLKIGAKNLIRDKENLCKENEIKCMNWSDERQYEILMGMKSTIRTYDIVNDVLSNPTALPANESCGIFKSDEKIFVGVTSGSVHSVTLLKNDTEWTEELKMNQPIERLRRGIVKTNIVATGGKGNDLKLWDLNSKQTTFVAKNIKPDELQLQAPMWVSDIAFCRQNENVATCSRHGYVRLYDPLLPQRRPVFNAHQAEQVFTCITCAPTENQFLVGSGTGELFHVDVRGKNSFIGKYKGFAGAVKDVVCLQNQSLVLSVSLDRHFRIHDFSTRKLILKEYMQTRLTSILPTEPFVIEEIKTVKSEIEESNDVPVMSYEENVVSERDVKDLDKLFDKLDKIDEPNAKKLAVRSLHKKQTVKTETNSDLSEENHPPKRIRWNKNV